MMRNVFVACLTLCLAVFIAAPLAVNLDALDVLDEVSLVQPSTEVLLDADLEDPLDPALCEDVILPDGTVIADCPAHGKPCSGPPGSVCGTCGPANCACLGGICRCP